ncbi:MAG: hypothetical protein HQL30_11955 [Candidatus Omnitrophica bacterium]|nr:hypothetical protein [Candidatus Omnitrophota bacterium]
MREGIVGVNNHIWIAAAYFCVITAVSLGVLAGYAAGSGNSPKAEIVVRPEEPLDGAVYGAGIYPKSSGLLAGETALAEGAGIFFRVDPAEPENRAFPEFVRSYAWCYLTAVVPLPVWMLIAWGISAYRRRKEERARDRDGEQFFALDAFDGASGTILAAMPEGPARASTAYHDATVKHGMDSAHAGSSINTAHIRSEFLKKMIKELRVQK